MIADIVALTGSEQLDLHTLRAGARQFGWEFEATNDLGEVIEWQSKRRTLALFFDLPALGPGYTWVDAVRRLRQALPGVRLIVCHGISEVIDWPQLSQAGAFHELLLPLTENETRQSLGFVWASETRLADTVDEFQHVFSYPVSSAIQSVPAHRHHRRIAAGTASR
jgi:hypothetical protein